MRKTLLLQVCKNSNNLGPAAPVLISNFFLFGIMIYSKKIGNDSFTLVCETWEDSTSWGHLVTLYQNGLFVDRAKVRYFNRTWESYRYQYAIRSVISNTISNLTDALKSDFKRLNGFKILTKNRLVAFDAFLLQNQRFVKLGELYKMF